MADGTEGCVDAATAVGIALGAIAAITGGLAGHLAAQKLWHKLMFWILALLSVILLLFQGHYIARELREAEERGKKQQAQLDQIEKNTANPPRVTVNIPASIPASPVTERPPGSIGLTRVEFPPSWQTRPYIVDLHLVNVGQIPISDAFAWETVNFEGVATLSSLEDSQRANHRVYLKLLAEAHDAVKNARTAGNPPMDFAINDDHPHPFTLHLDSVLMSYMVEGATRLYFFAYVEWDGGRQNYTACRWLQRPQSLDESATGYVLNDCTW
jgi:hypothetical protein